LICGLEDGTINIIDLNTGMEKHEIEGHQSQIDFVQTFQYKK